MDILIVDSSIVYRKILRRAIEAVCEGALVEYAATAQTAVGLINEKSFDVVLIDSDIFQEESSFVLKEALNSLQDVFVICLIRKAAESKADSEPCGNIKVGGRIIKPIGENYDKNIELISERLLEILPKVNNRREPEVLTETYAPPAEAKKPAAPAQRADKSPFKADVIVIAASTGGPQALDKVFSGFLRTPKPPILIVQHMPPNFTSILAENLSKKSSVHVVEGFNGDIITPGKAYIAPGGIHMTVSHGVGNVKIIRLKDRDPVNGVKPSADVLFESVACFYEGMNVLAVVLTGMGCDGANGIEIIKKRCNCHCITQSKESCVVYGMPRAAAERSLSDEVAHIEHMSRLIEERINFGFSSIKC